MLHLVEGAPKLRGHVLRKARAARSVSASSTG
jgi:hypothetical protein